MPLDFASLRAELQAREEAVRLRMIERDQALLADRARRLAVRELAAEQPAALGSYVIVRRGDLALGLPAAQVGEVRVVTAVRVPHATSVVQGAFQVRGSVYALVDLLPLLGGHGAIDHGASTTVAILTAGRSRFGLRVDAAVAWRTIAVRELDPHRRERGPGFVAHVTTDLVHLIDAEALSARPELTLSGGHP